MPIKPLRAKELYRACDPATLSFRTTAELADPDAILGQERAVEALQFGIGMRSEGYNLFVLGPSATGRHALVRQFLERRAAGEPKPRDWVYVNNFEIAHRPNAVALPPGRAVALRYDMERFIEELQAAIPAVFESDEYRTRRQAIEEEFKERQEGAFQEVQAEAQRRGLALVQTPTGLVLAPVKGNEVMPPEEFRGLPEPARKAMESDIEELQKRLQETVRQLPEWDRERRHKVREVNREMTQLAVTNLIAALKRTYADLPEILGYFDAVQHDVIEHVDIFLPQEAQSLPAMMQPAAAAAIAARVAALRRYQINVLVSSDGAVGAPVVTEEMPAQANLVGRVEHMQEMGALMTDFTLIKPGALHRANGGYLVLDALRLLQQPYAWEALKRALRSRVVAIESPAQMLSLISTVSLEPEPIPLDVKVVLIGERQLYYQLSRLDPDFDGLFKVAVDLEEDMRRNPETTAAYARLIAAMARRCSLRPVNRQGVARIIEHAARLAGDRDKLTVRIGWITDLIREADYFAGNGSRRAISAGDVQSAIDAHIHRSDRVRDRVQESILDETMLIATDGEAVGQINGLAVLDLGNFAFGRPNRISARVRLGTGEVVDIERRVELGGPLHSKGVLILSAYLGAHFAAEHPLSLSASLVFEQSYGGVDGDSASSAELYALLSALSDLPIHQGFAVTGSVNQHGEVQAIGGVNEKIEGFFDICNSRGLDGRQGVLIPQANVKHLMLRNDVVAAVRSGRFRVFAVAKIDQGIEILTGRAAGAPRKDGSYPPDTVNRLVQDRLLQLATKRREFGRRDNSDNDGNNDKTVKLEKPA